MGFLSQHKLTLALAGVVIAGAAWWGLSGSSTPVPILSGGGSGTAPDQSLVTTLLQLRSVSLSGTILTEPAFTGLKDFGQQIMPEPVGRANPFLIILPSADSSAVSSKTSTLPSTKRP